MPAVGRTCSGSSETPLPSAPKEDENMDKQLQVLLAIEIELENLEKLYNQKIALDSAEDRTAFLNKTGGPTHAIDLIVLEFTTW
jgi:hypothetical protein